jgi:hypothetical protein
VDQRAVPAVFALLALGALLFGMYAGWRARGRRQAGLPAPASPPAELGRTLAVADALYVATTTAGRPLDRIVVGGLGFRARAVVRVTERGVVLDLTGSPDIFVSTSVLRGAGLGTFAVDRVVETGGLVVLTWLLDVPGQVAVDTYLRVTDTAERDALLAALTSLSPAGDGTGTTGSADPNGRNSSK